MKEYRYVRRFQTDNPEEFLRAMAREGWGLFSAEREGGIVDIWYFLFVRDSR